MAGSLWHRERVRVPTALGTTPGACLCPCGPGGGGRRGPRKYELRLQSGERGEGLPVLRASGRTAGAGVEIALRVASARAVLRFGIFSERRRVLVSLHLLGLGAFGPWPKLGRVVSLRTSRESVCVWGAPRGTSQAGPEAVIVNPD